VLAHRTVGSGPPLLLINGYAATGADWDPTFLAALAESFLVICPDNRGVGDSEAGEGELTIDAMAADCEALLDGLGIGRCAVAGWSMGGFVAQRLTLRAPNRVSSLALLATDPGGPGSVPADPATWSRLTDHSGSAREQATRLISLLFPPPLAERIDAEFGDLVAAARAALDPAVLRGQEAAMESWHRDGASQPAPAEAPPTLILHGDLDEVIPAANAEPLAAHWPGARVEILEGCGHALMAQEPKRVKGSLVHAL
jgi:pimeloyl-ACP methyl ester carboxylesterase